MYNVKRLKHYRLTFNKICKKLKITKEMTKLEATAKVSGFRGKYTDDELSAKLGITRPTLYARLLKHNWKLGEIQLILSLK